ncbi:hypothetical protein [uncultured Sphingomonas sp.]|uniref:hypothetical protein n=1 Tax=uncultured Sphingomonas sp. TaxID=158754 RepID=UPI0025F87D11|nr:hypothetical protein [uncultured Sphingomonas sp.]
MSDEKSDKAAKSAPVREARGAAQEAIGKLLGDDQAVRDGRSEQRDAAKQQDAEAPKTGARDTDTNNPKQEQE